MLQSAPVGVVTNSFVSNIEEGCSRSRGVKKLSEGDWLAEGYDLPLPDTPLNFLIVTDDVSLSLTSSRVRDLAYGRPSAFVATYSPQHACFGK